VGIRVPEALVPLVDQGIIDEVIRPLMAGKEAQVYLVVADGTLRVAKVYKEVEHRSFKHRAAYTEGRKVRNTRQQRAMAKKSKYGKAEIETAWRNAEVDAMRTLWAAGVRVPEQFDFVDGVLLMELVHDGDWGPAPRLADVQFSPEEANDLFLHLVHEVAKMLCAGVVHGDLSDFNVLIGHDGPVIIDFPQWVDPAGNLNARKLLLRDVDNLTSFLARHDPSLKRTRYAEEMWALYEANTLTPQTELTGKFRRSQRLADTSSLLAEIESIEAEERKRRESLGLPPPRPARRPVNVGAPAPRPLRPGDGRGEAKRGRGDAKPAQSGGQGDGRSGDRRRGDRPDERSRRSEPYVPKAVQPPPSTGGDGAGPGSASAKKRRRRRKKKPGGPAVEAAPIDPFDDLDALLSIDD
jgi:RIO kinase 1